DALAVSGEADHLDEPPAALAAHGGRHVEEPAVEVERLLGVEEAVEVGLLGQVADALVLLDVGGGLAEDEGLAVGGEEQAEEQLDGGGLAGAVGAEQAEDLAPVDFQVEGAEGDLFLPAPEVPVDLGQLARLDDHFSGHRRQPRLQWVHGRMAVVMTTITSRDVGSSLGFNGSTAGWPWLWKRPGA